LRNRQFTERTIGGNTIKRTLATTAEIRVVLQDEFLIRLPQHPDLDRKLGSLPD
jgi:N-hydroxyarylamine O-acetyltransferase